MPHETCFSALQIFVYLSSCRTLSETEMLHGREKNEPEHSLLTRLHSPALSFSDLKSEVGWQPSLPVTVVTLAGDHENKALWFQNSTWSRNLVRIRETICLPNADGAASVSETLTLSCLAGCCGRMGSAPSLPWAEILFPAYLMYLGSGRVCKRRRDLVLVTLAHTDRVGMKPCF